MLACSIDTWKVCARGNKPYIDTSRFYTTVLVLVARYAAGGVNVSVPKQRSSVEYTMPFNAWIFTV